MLEIFQYAFMQRALMAGLVIGLIAPLIGTFLVTRRYALMADTLSHLSLAGVAIGLLAGISPIAAALGVTILGAIGIETLRKNRTAAGESILALFLSGGLAVAIILLSLGSGSAGNTLAYLFGSIALVSPEDVIMIVGLGIVVLLVILLSYRKMFLLSLDTDLAVGSGIRAGFYNYLLVILTAVTVSLSMRIVGILLVGSLMVTPVLAASQLTKSFRSTMLLAVLFSEAAVVAGLILSYIWNLASGGVIVLIALGIFLGCVGWKRVRR